MAAAASPPIASSMARSIVRHELKRVGRLDVVHEVASGDEVPDRDGRLRGVEEVQDFHRPQANPVEDLDGLHRRTHRRSWVVGQRGRVPVPSARSLASQRTRLGGQLPHPSPPA